MKLYDIFRDEFVEIYEFPFPEEFVDTWPEVEK